MRKWPKIGEIINVQAYKHNGLLYRQWNGLRVIENTSTGIVLLAYKTKVSEQSGPKWVMREPQLWFFYFDSFRNTTALLRKLGTYFYTNLASPPIFEDNTIKFIDYDLDVKFYPGKDTKIVDKNEYKTNVIKYNYSKKLQEKIDESLKEVIEDIALKSGFFNNNYINKIINKLIKDKLLKENFRKNKS